jgi:hypothetical protein
VREERAIAAAASAQAVAAAAQARSAAADKAAQDDAELRRAQEAEAYRRLLAGSHPGERVKRVMAAMAAIAARSMAAERARVETQAAAAASAQQAGAALRAQRQASRLREAADLFQAEQRPWSSASGPRTRTRRVRRRSCSPHPTCGGTCAACWPTTALSLSKVGCSDEH